MVQWHITVTGKVQGVGFRYFAQMKAAHYSITGWVRNLDDGSVEMVAVGENSSLTLFVEELKKGNRFAKINDITIFQSDHVENFKSFKIIY